jgi:glycosyltransferase involved in cell wall biosynthesis
MIFRERPGDALTGQQDPSRGPLRILMVSDEWPPYFGGAGLCMGLFASELVRIGHTVSVATVWHPDAPNSELDRGVLVHRIRELPSRALWMSEDPVRQTPAPFPDPEAVWRLRRIIDDFEPDLIPAYGWLAHSAACALTGRDIPMILWGHDYGNVCAMRTLYRLNREICSGPALGKCMACATAGRGPVRGPLAVAGVLGMRRTLRKKVSALHSVSGFVASVLSRDLGRGRIPSVVIENFHEDKGLAEPDHSILDRLPDQPFILFVGALSRVKGVKELLEAYSRLEQPPPLVMVGYPTPETPEHFPPGVTLLSEVPHPTVMAMWERALFGVFPSKWPEPLATVVHEAMSKGRPVIGTTPGGHEDMIDNGESGLIVPAGDSIALGQAMASLIEDDALRERMGAAAFERAKLFTRDIVMPKLEAFYYETVDRYRTGSQTCDP